MLFHSSKAKNIFCSHFPGEKIEIPLGPALLRSRETSADVARWFHSALGHTAEEEAIGLVAPLAANTGMRAKRE